MTGRSPRRTKRLTLRQFVWLSIGCHLLAGVFLGFAPSRPAPIMEPIISVDLLAALPRAAPAEPAAVPAAERLEVDKSPPVPEAAPKPLPRPKKIVLPKKAPSANRKPRKVEQRPRRARPQKLGLSDALAQLRGELGESEPTRDVAKAESSAAAAAASLQDIEMRKWLEAVKRHVRVGWGTPQEFLDRDLVTRVGVVLAADGRVLGEPRVVVASGDPFYDDNTIRAIWRATPLPPPPEPGEWQLSFPSRERQ